MSWLRNDRQMVESTHLRRRPDRQKNDYEASGPCNGILRRHGPQRTHASSLALTMTIPAITSLTSSHTWPTTMPPLARTDSHSFFRTVRSDISSTSIESHLGPPFLAFDCMRGALPA